MSQVDDFEGRSTGEAVRGVSAAVAASEFQRASALADAALGDGLIHPAFFNARALWFERQGRDQEALQSYQQARALSPRNAILLNAIGACLTRLGMLDEAIATFDAAIRIAPAYAPSYQRKALALGLSGRPIETEHAYRRALQLDPHDAEALAGMASFAARSGRYERALPFAQRALSLDPGNPTANAALAMVELSREEFEPAEIRVRALCDNLRTSRHGHAVGLGLLGDALNGQNRFAEAFAAYGAANAEHEALNEPRFRGRPSVVEAIDELIAAYGDAAPEVANAVDVPEAGGDGGTKGHVFLLGFHRSGTTLLEQVLESHPDITTLEERDFLADAADRYLSTADGRNRLATLEGPELAMARSAYWDRVRGLGIDVRNRVFVDKHPFNVIKLPLIRRLFPEARILFALRDPRDVIWSCFRRQFEIDAVRYEFLTLERAARLYDRVMRLGTLCREIFSLRIFEHRYEGMIDDFDGSMRAVCAFIDLPWSESMRNFPDTALERGIHSPSAGQVRRPLYAEGVGQWRHYKDQLAPVEAVLHPWIDRFGYPAQ